MIFFVIFLLTHRGPRVKLGIYKGVLTFNITFVGRTVKNSNQGGGIHPPSALKGLIFAYGSKLFHFNVHFPGGLTVIFNCTP